MKLTDQQHQTLIDILNHLIPANAELGIAAGGGAGTVRYLLTEAIDKDPQLRGSIDLILGATSGKTITVELLQSVESDHPQAFQTLLTETYKGYYSQSPVRGALGLSPQPVHPAGYAVTAEPADLLAELTAPVKDRGRCYRDTEHSGGH